MSIEFLNYKRLKIRFHEWVLTVFHLIVCKIQPVLATSKFSSTYDKDRIKKFSHADAFGMHRKRVGAMAASHFYFAPRASNRG